MPSQRRRKLEPKSSEGVVIGCYENRSYKVWWIRDRKAPVLSRHIRILENEFPSTEWYGFSAGDSSQLDDEDDNVLGSRPVLTPQMQQPVSEPPEGQFPTPLQQTIQAESAPLEERLTYIPPIAENTVESAEAQEQVSGIAEENFPGSDEHGRAGGVGLTDNSASHGSGSSDRYPRRNRQSPNYFKPGSSFIATGLQEPSTVSDALAGDEADNWAEAIKSEMESLNKHDTWTVSRTPDDAKVLSTRFIFRKKTLKDGTVGRYKARLVVRGFLQGFVDNTYSPVVDFTTIRTALAIGIQRGFYIHQMDVRTAFLHGKIDEDVYVHPPEGSGIILRSGQSLKLGKGLYGLKQSPRLWFQKWKDVMKELGFSQLAADLCAFRRGWCGCYFMLMT